jgi:ferric-dicitrate binding protein FerR (iron transport regulator)
MKPDPDRKPTKAEMRAGGMVAIAVLVFLALFVVVFVWIGG